MSSAEYPEPITVEIDSEVQSIVPAFLDNRRRDCLTICSLLEGEAFREISALGHRMKGSGGSYGFDDISRIGEVIEKAAHATDKKTISNAILQLSSYLERVTVVYV